MIGTGTSAKQSITPPGFEGGDENHARGHLLAKQLGGSGDNANNLVTLYQKPTNNPNMRKVENQVVNAVKNDEIVNYKVTPIYNGSDPKPIAITMEAKGNKGLNIAVSILNISY